MSSAAAVRAGPAPVRAARTRQIDQLDGVRALAVLAVMFFHDFLSAAGYFGVDVFYVLSGMLITGVLLGEWEARGAISLRRFYARRMLRLYPALAVMLLLTSPFGAHLVDGAGWGTWWVAVATSATYTANIAILADGTQFLGALGPMWSLAVEMQFYLLWPLAFTWLLRRGIDRRVLIVAVCAAAAGCLSLFWALGTTGPAALAVAPSYFRPDARFGEILTGCALALLLAARTGPLSRALDRALTALAVLGLGGLLLARQVLLDHGTVAPLPIVAVSTALVLARLATSDHALLSRLLRVWPLPQIGRISYAMYLWQLPILGVLSWLQPSATAQQVLYWGGTLAAGALSTHVVERRFLRRKDRLRSTAVAAGIGRP